MANLLEISKIISNAGYKFTEKRILGEKGDLFVDEIHIEALEHIDIWIGYETIEFPSIDDLNDIVGDIYGKISEGGEAKGENTEVYIRERICYTPDSTADELTEAFSELEAKVLGIAKKIDSAVATFEAVAQVQPNTVDAPAPEKPLRIQRMYSSGQFMDIDNADLADGLVSRAAEFLSVEFEDVILKLGNGETVRFGMELGEDIRCGNRADKRLEAARARKDAEPMTRCDCGHTVPSTWAMSASAGTSCSDCYDRMSD